MTDYRVTVKVQNNNIVKRILDAGYRSVGEFCRMNSCLHSANSKLGSIINMKESPLTARGEFHTCIRNAALILKCSPEDFFTDNQLQCAMESNRRVLEIEEAELKFILGSHVEPKLLEDEVMSKRLPNEIEKLLENLTPREAKVISMRFGVNGAKGEHTLEEVASNFGVTRERIRVIEVKALRKLRHPVRSENIREYI